MSDAEDHVLFESTIDTLARRGDEFRSMTTASRHMRAAVAALENVRDERAQQSIRHLLDAITSLTSIEVPT